jgi:hypothetical protein
MIIVIGGNNIMKLIDKSVLVEWIKKEDKEMQPNKDWHFDEYTEGYVDALAKILSFIDTLEVKEVDFAKEFYTFSKKHKLMDKGIEFSDIEKTASFFFQLGLKASNPITVTDQGIVNEIIFALNTLGEEKMISYDKEIEWLKNQVKKEC